MKILTKVVNISFFPQTSCVSFVPLDYVLKAEETILKKLLLRHMSFCDSQIEETLQSASLMLQLFFLPRIPASIISSRSELETL